MSPPAKTFLLVVWNGNSPSVATRSRPLGSVSMPCSSNQEGGFGRKPNAIITASAGRISSVPGTVSGRRRPSAPGSPSRVSITLTPVTRSVPTISSGCRLKRKLTPSSLLFQTSRREPGMFSSSRR